MNSSLTLNRIRSQMATNTPPVAQAALEAAAQVLVGVPISLEELREILLKELGAVAPPPPPCPVMDAIHFENIYDFSSWYSSNQGGFTEQQRTALDTLLQARAAIEAGCACKRKGREEAAHMYFANFWNHNKETDLLATISKITGAKKITINSYCSFARE